MRCTNLLRPAALAASAWSVLFLIAAARADEPAQPNVNQPAPEQVVAEEVVVEELVAEQPDGPAQDRPASKYWIGIECNGADGAPGMLVTRVIPGGPAEVVGIVTGDRILKVGGQDITSIDHLIMAVSASEGKELTLDVRHGDEVRQVALTPQERPSQPSAVHDLLRHLTGEGDPGRLVESFRHRLGPLVDEYARRIGPGLIVHEPLPDDVTITVTRSGSQPAQIKVARGDESWELKEGELDQLPPELRNHVQHMLGGDVLVRVLPHMIAPPVRPMPPVVVAPPGAPVPPVAPAPPVPPGPQQDSPRLREEIRERFEAEHNRLRRQVEEAREEQARRRQERQRVGQGPQDASAEVQAPSAIEQRVDAVVRQLELQAKDIERRIDEHLKEKSKDLEKVLDEKSKLIEKLLETKMKELEELLKRLPAEKPADGTKV